MRRCPKCLSKNHLCERNWIVSIRNSTSIGMAAKIKSLRAFHRVHTIKCHTKVKSNLLLIVTINDTDNWNKPSTLPGKTKSHLHTLYQMLEATRHKTKWRLADSYRSSHKLPDIFLFLISTTTLPGKTKSHLHTLYQTLEATRHKTKWRLADSYRSSHKLPDIFLFLISATTWLQQRASMNNTTSDQFIFGWNPFIESSPSRERER